MKAFEVKTSVRMGYKDQTATYFVEAESKKQLMSLESVLKVWERKDMQPNECPMQIIDEVICQKEDFQC